MLRDKSPKGGFVILNHSSRIDSLVNGLFALNRNNVLVNNPNRVPTDVVDTTIYNSLGIPKSYKKQEGYRIQIFTGGNSRADKDKALLVQKKFENLFPDIKVYTNFVSPRWVVRVGDFVNRSEAMEWINKINDSKISYEARIVKCTIMLPQYD